MNDWGLDAWADREMYGGTGSGSKTSKSLLPQETESHYVVSPSTPLLSTAIDENSLICGKNLMYCHYIIKS